MIALVLQSAPKKDFAIAKVGEYIRQKFYASLSKKIGVNTCFGDGHKVRNDDLS